MARTPITPAKASVQEVLTAHSSLLRVLFLSLVHQFEDHQIALDQIIGHAKEHLATVNTIHALSVGQKGISTISAAR